VLLTHSLALVFPSKYEGFGFPAVEAMAAGAPVVASRIPALSELIGDAGVLVPSADSELEIAEALVALSSRDAARQGLLDLGRSRAREFTWKRAAHRLVEAMRRASE
jgi:glycosyltransferase involved in cell wall biosynthesis